MKTLLLALFLILSLSVRAFAFGEIFKIETTGTEFCGDFDFDQFNPKNNTDFGWRW